MNNHYFEAVEPIFYLEKVGISLSNVHIGRLQAFDNVYIGRNSKPGDVFHLLVGGNFVVSADGKISEIDMWHPKPLLESSYGPRATASQLFERYEKAGVARRMQSPEGKIDYASCRALPQLPENHVRLRYDGSSATLTRLVEAGGLVSGLADDLGFEVKRGDFHTERVATMRVVRNEDGKSETVFDMRLTEAGELFIRPWPPFFDCPAFVDAQRGHPHFKTGYGSREAFWVTDASFLEDDTFLDQLAIGFDKAAGVKPTAAAAPAPTS
ncbi:hypothetical protein HFO56_33275 [Rhizobium laguerreae]|uniref:hypothetical protein n=1 Tax=Rhizobium laguerreae TaxID=1076926 RepID=UPI001C917B37|nr:hypothetical protein [Rhizobium laguerreae]MBY3157198.1 hypothetical protein [Rhizobium laguerreae]